MLVSCLFRIRKDQYDFLKNLPGETVAYVRIALDDFIQKKRSESVSASQSKRGGENG